MINTYRDVTNMYQAAQTGNYTPVGDRTSANQVVAHSFGFRQGSNGERLAGPVNEELGLHLGALGLHELPWVVQEEVWEAVPDDVKLTRFVAGTPTLIMRQADMPNGKYLSSADNWAAAQKQATELSIFDNWNPVVIGQAHHEARIADQGRRIGAKPVVPGGLTKDFDPQSAQPWTANPNSWIKREVKVLAAIALSKLTGNRLFKGRV